MKRPLLRRSGISHAFAITAATLLLASCGLSEDGDPHAIARGNLPPDLLDPNPTSSTTLPPGETVPVTIYLLRETGEDTELVPVTRPVKDASDPGPRISALLSAQPTEEEAGLSNAIPPEVELLEAPLDTETGELTIDLSGEFSSIEGSELSKAFAQIVYTAAELEGVTSVRFRVDGEPRQAVDADGGQQRSVDIGDYRELAPT